MQLLSPPAPPPRETHCCPGWSRRARVSPVPAAGCGAGLLGEAGVAFCLGSATTPGSEHTAIGPERGEEGARAPGF